MRERLESYRHRQYEREPRLKTMSAAVGLGTDSMTFSPFFTDSMVYITLIIKDTVGIVSV